MKTKTDVLLELREAVSMFQAQMSSRSGRKNMHSLAKKISSISIISAIYKGDFKDKDNLRKIVASLVWCLKITEHECSRFTISKFQHRTLT
jgi:hypothetical protein